MQVRAVGVNPIDWKLYSGTFHAVDEDQLDEAGLSASMPSLGLECARAVIDVGSDVDDVEEGEEVIVFPVTAAYADYVIAAPLSLIRKPASLGWAEAAGLMLAGTTAADALHAVGVNAGDTVLIHGGSGGVGLMAVAQVRTTRRRAVVTTVSARNHDLIQDLGAIAVTYGPVGSPIGSAPQCPGESTLRLTPSEPTNRSTSPSNWSRTERGSPRSPDRSGARQRGSSSSATARDKTPEPSSEHPCART